MSCSCRTAPWRTFLRGLAQVHKLDGPSSSSSSSSSVSLSLRAGPFLQSATFGGQGIAMLRQSRGLYRSAYSRQEATASAAVAESSEPKPATATEVMTDAVEKNTPKKTTKSTAETKAPRKRIAKEASGKKTTKKTSEKGAASERQEAAGEEKQEAKSPIRTAQTQTPEFLEQAPVEVSWKSTPSTGDNEKPRRPRKPELPKAVAADTSKPKGAAPVHKPMTPKESWQLQKATLRAKFPEGWRPRKRLSPDALAGIRALNAQFPDVYTTEALADKFEVAPEAIRRILKGKWQPSVDEEQNRQDRWFRRGQQVWEQQAALGMKPPKRWRAEGIARDPGYHEWSKKASRREREWEEEEIRKYKELRAREKKENGGTAGAKGATGTTGSTFRR